MKVRIILLAALAWCHTTYAQKKSNPQLFFGNGALQQVPFLIGADNPGGIMYLQVGNPIPYSTATSTVDNSTITVRFPWDVPYIPLTFSNETFEVSKGYFSDRIQIKWNVLANSTKISKFAVYRRLYQESNTDDVANYTLIATLSSDAFSFDDPNVQGATLYEYKVVAVGVSSIPRKLVTYNTGVGIRNPTGVVTGNVSYDGGSPVKDVVIRAEPQGAELTFGSSVQLTGNGSLVVDMPKKQLSQAITLQGWFKLVPNTTSRLFELADRVRTTDTLRVSYASTSSGLVFSSGIGNSVNTYGISGQLPSGNLNGRGDDEFYPLSGSNWDQFIHVSVVLNSGKSPVIYINGRPIDQQYAQALQSPNYTGTSVPVISTGGSYVFNGFPTAQAIVGRKLTGNVDEVRMWSAALSEARIRTDFKRYLGGTEVNLVSYLRCDEQAGKFAYDISRVGFEFNKSDARINYGIWSTLKPTPNQLGILGVTDELGNYIISAIPFKFTGESYTITPLYGVHQFQPAQQLVFIGSGAEVINKIEFKDISAFNFIGKVYYTTDGVFDPIVKVSGVTQVSEDGYNQYKAIINGTEQLVSKGENTLKNGELFETPKVFLEGANVFVDGNLVFDKDKRPVLTDQKGEFNIKVPIGNHYIEVKKDKHFLMHSGRFPAARADGKDLFEFFENQESPVTFLDTTRVVLVGRVVGGTVESAKPIGFGSNGLVKDQYTDPETGASVTKTVSSVNNIGTATLTLGFLPYGASPGQEIKTSFTTNTASGEYRVKLVPLNYTISQVDGIRIPTSNPSISILAANEPVNLAVVPELSTSNFTKNNGTRLVSEPYHFKRSFTYRSAPVLSVERQLSEENITVPTRVNGRLTDKEISTEGFKYKIFQQFQWYAVDLVSYEEYVNRDANPPVSSKVPIEDIEFSITNNLADRAQTSQVIERDATIPSLSHYRFKAGAPSITRPFIKTINIRYVVNGVSFDAVGYTAEGIILGGQPEGTTFSTVAPDLPDIILRDPPGSNSFATIEKGSSFSYTQQANRVIGQGAEGKLTLNLGSKVTTSAGVGAEVETSIEILNDIGTGISMKVESDDGNSITKSYTFNQTISTSDDPQYVGSDADLYIGNSVNHFYGKFQKLQTSDTIPAPLATGLDTLKLRNAQGQLVIISKQNSFIFNREPTSTFFVYSQRYIIETLIPSFEEIVASIDAGQVTPNTPGVMKRDFYVEQIRLWKKVIQDNERLKWQVINEREVYKTKLLTDLYSERQIVKDYLTEIEVAGALAIASSAISPFLTFVGIQSVAEAERIMSEKEKLIDKKIALIDAEFSKNISFDAGVGEISRSVETSLATTKEQTLKFDTDAQIALNLGALVNETGVQLSTTNSINTSLNAALNSEETETTKVTYTLKDNDPYNFLSVDVVNAFDGNGPIFVTLGGRTSCPYEGPDSTFYYNDSQFKADRATVKTAIYDGGEVINTATQRVEDPTLSVEIASVTDVPEDRAAEFRLIIENNSIAQADGNFLLLADNRTNPNNAILNLDPNGTLIFVPYGKRTEFLLTLRKSVADVYDYRGIRITLASLCDGIIDEQDARLISQGGKASVFISATFRPSCTKVEVKQPLANWVFNATDAFNADNTTNPLKLSAFGYNRAYNSFEKFSLEYRNVTSSTWTRLKTYYNTSALYNSASVNGEENIQEITSTQSDFNWDIGRIGLADGQYEVRAVSYCANGTQFISDPIRGTVDLNVPVQFGTPSPADGILGPGEDLLLGFSENILYNSAISKVQIKGRTNQADIDHAVSLYFAGAQNTAVIEKPNILKGTFTAEFWMKNETTGPAVIMEQAGAMKLSLASGVMTWKFGQQSLSKPIASDQAFHHYTLTYNAATQTMRMYQDDQDLGSTINASGLSAVSQSPLVIGGNTFIGNIHDLRFWSKSLSLSEAYAAQFKELTGSERNLVGYWPMNEGYGPIANDIARFRHAAVKTNWDIKPKGKSYSFESSQYQILDDVNFVQLTDLMDITLTFWIKTDQQTRGTIFSNGRGNGQDIDQSNGKDNKMSVTIDGGNLYLISEGNTFALTTTGVADNKWHHVAIVLRRNGSLKTFIDAAQVSSNAVAGLGGLSGNKFWIGARGYANVQNVETIDEFFTGRIDELQLWNLARANEQLSRDRFNEIDFNSIGLLLYARMNPPDPLTANGPAYYHAAANETMLSSFAKVNSGAIRYSDDAPSVRGARPYLSFLVNHVINEDEILLTPLVSDWAVLEGQIIDITVDRLFDTFGNRQASPVTWSAFVRRNEVAWFTDNGTQQLEILKPAAQPSSFKVTLVNKGGKQQPFSIQNIPSWLKATGTTGTLEPNSTREILFTIASDLTIGQYELDLFLDTDFNFDEKILLKVRVLGQGPDWMVNPAAFENSMSIIGKVRINGVFSSDIYSKLGAFVGDQPRGVASLEYDADYEEYFVYLNIYSNQSSGESVSFKIWDATTGKVYKATVNGDQSIAFIQNEVYGYKAAPYIFESTNFVDQSLTLNKGWTWVSLYARDPKLADINSLTQNMSRTQGDLIKSQTSFNLYDASAGWTGGLSATGGLKTAEMYKFKLGAANTLSLSGPEVDAAAFSVNIKPGWNWLTYPLSGNLNVREALSLLDASEGDVIKSQRGFSVYDPRIGWSGTLQYMVVGEGYMLKSNAAVAQLFSYPQVFTATGPGRTDNTDVLTSENYALFEHNMNIIAEVTGEVPYDEVLVLDDQGTLRGRGTIRSESGRWMSYLTVYGSGSAQDHLEVYLASGGSRWVTGTTLTFAPDQLAGTLSQPLLLTAMEGDARVFPNPFETAIQVLVQANVGQHTEFRITDVQGRTVHLQSAKLVSGTNLIKLDPEVRPGMYLLSFPVDDRRVVIKVIKK